MTQQKGRLLLLKRGDGGGTEAFATVCGITTRSISVNNNEVDVTVPDCSTPGDKVLANTAYGIQTLEVSGEGKFTSEAAHKAVANDALNQATGNYQVVVPGWGTFTGAVFIGSYELSGETEGDMDFSISLRLNDHTFAAE
jgi:TP901-1 family phage major tail protein